MNNLKNKILFKRLLLGLKVGWNAPTLFSRVFVFKNHPLVRIFRVTRGISILTVLSKKHLLLLFPFEFIVLFFALSHFIYISIVAIIKLLYGFKVLKSDKLDVKNSPLDHFATTVGKLLYCWEYGCQAGSAGLSLVGTSFLIDSMLEAGNQEKIFTPLIGKNVKFILNNKPADETLLSIKKEIKNLEDSKARFKEISDLLEKTEGAFDYNDFSKKDIDSIKSTINEVKNMEKNKISDYASDLAKNNRKYSEIIKNKMDNNMNKNFNFSLEWFSGFVQSDGCFTITFEKKKTGLLIKPKPIFVLTQDCCEKILFKNLHNSLGTGYVIYNKQKKNVSLYITSISSLEKILFPIFDKYPLRYGKLRAYYIFKLIVKKMLNKEHLNLKGLTDIIYLSFKLNSATSRQTDMSKQRLLNFLENKHGILPFSNCLQELHIPNTRSKLTLDFITGLVDGDGSFNVSFQIKPYRRIRINFTVVQETSCKEVLNELKAYFNCGNVYDLPSAASRYQVENIDLILDNIKPIFDKVIFNTIRAEHYKIAIKVSEIIRTKGYKTNDTFKQIIELAYNSNKLGKRRKISKQELIKKIDKLNN